MNLLLSIVLFVVGLGLVIFFAEKLVEGVVGTSSTRASSPWCGPSR